MIVSFALSTHALRTTPRFVSMSSSSDTSSSITIATLRKEYSKKGLDESNMSSNPIDVFKEWFEEALAAEVLEPNAFCLSTCVHSQPSARIVLMKGFDERGIVWFTNYESQKSRELAKNPYAAATFWWGPLERQVRMEGTVERVSDQESEEYHAIRPRSAQIGAWSSQQSKPIKDRAALEEQEAASIARFDGVEQIERPKHWGGWRLRPSRIEFWKGREARLHDRIVYTRMEDNKWSLQRIQP